LRIEGAEIEEVIPHQPDPPTVAPVSLNCVFTVFTVPFVV